jgi:cytochrome c oxidase cbb3-type subunit 4
MTSGVVQGLVTLVLMLVFVGVCAWSWSSRRRSGFERAARLPLEEDAR